MKKTILMSALALAVASPAIAADTEAAVHATPGEVVTMMNESDMRASQWLGAPVKNEADETVGDINDFIVGTDGKITAIVAGVGGFLGIGEKNVGLAFENVELVRSSDGTHVAKVAISKEQLESAPDFKTGEKTLRDRAKEASDAAAKTYESAKENVKAGYEAAKENAKKGYDAAKEAIDGKTAEPEEQEKR